MKTYFLKLYQYNDWANRRVLSCLEGQKVNDEKIVSAVSNVGYKAMIVEEEDGHDVSAWIYGRLPEKMLYALALYPWPMLECLLRQNPHTPQAFP